MITISTGGACPSNVGPCFPNMAGRDDCDAFLQRELERAGIEVVRGERRRDEVPATITGKLGPFTFDRAWYYWRVSGPMPLEVARKLYAHPDGRKDVRVAGRCGCPPPDDWARYYDAEGMRLYSDPDGKRAQEWADFVVANPEYAEGDITRFVPDAAAVAAKAVVESYHIDTQAGMTLFAHAIRDHKLDVAT